MSWGGSGLSSPSSPPGQRRHWRAATAFPFVSPIPSSRFLCTRPSSSNIPPSFFAFLHSSFDPRLPSPPSFPQALRSNLPSCFPPFFPPSPFLSPSSRRVSLWGRPPPPSSAPPGLLMPRPLGRVPARMHIPDPGQAGLGLHLVCNGIFSTALCPHALPKSDGVLVVMKATRYPFFHPLLPLPAAAPPGMQPAGVCPSGSQLGGAQPGGASRVVRPEGCSKGHQSEGSAQRGAGSIPEGSILEGSSPRGIQAATWRGCCLGRGSAWRDAALTRYIPEDFS